MKIIKTPNLDKKSFDLLHNPGSLQPKDEANPILNPKINNDEVSILKRWNKKKKFPSKKIYQLGFDYPSLTNK